MTMNQVIVEIETAKAAVELPSPFAGRVEALLVDVGVTVRVGTPIITVDTQPGGGEVPAAAQTGPSNGASGPSGTTAADHGAGAKIGEVSSDGRIATLVGYVSATGTATGQVGAQTAAAPLATPPVRKLAKELGIDLTAVTATRPDGVISRSDVENASAAELPAEHVATSGAPPAGYDPATRELRVVVKGVRKATAAAMVASAFTAPHVTEFLTVDVTPMMELRDRLRRRPEFADIKLTPLAFAARAVCLAVRRTPELNAVLDEAAGEIVIKQYVHLGIAAATPRGLVVPVIRDADGLDLAGVAHTLTELAATARAGRTSLAEMTGGTFSITNVGVFGVDTGTPIINPGESAILALGSIKDAPWVVDGELAVRKVCQLALSFDHRVVDGQQGSQFLSDVGALLADPGLALAF